LHKQAERGSSQAGRHKQLSTATCTGLCFIIGLFVSAELAYNLWLKVLLAGLV